MLIFAFGKNEVITIHYSLFIIHYTLHLPPYTFRYQLSVEFRVAASNSRREIPFLNSHLRRRASSSLGGRNAVASSIFLRSSSARRSAWRANAFTSLHNP